MRKLYVVPITLAIALASLPVTAQILPDQTLPINSKVNTNNSILQITGGTTVGSNLFHSFEQFSVPNGSTGFFDNAIAISNILGRVTGDRASLIDGTLKANGTANLFLLNPNGIIFGQNSRLDLGGSFLATTANQVDFADGSRFSASITPPILTMSVPLGLQLGSQIANGNADIQVQGNLAVEKSLTLTGKNLLFTNGSKVTGSDINLQGQDLKVEGGSQIAIASSGGNLQVRSHTLTVADGSEITALNAGAEIGANIDIQTKAIALNGNNSRIATETSGTGHGGNLTINTDSLGIKNGGYISASTLGAGQGGNLNLQVRGDINIAGTGTYENVLNQLFLQGTGLVTQPTITKPADIANGILLLSFGSGGSGNLNLQADRLTMSNGAFISTATLGNGNGGNFNVNAKAITLTASQFFADSFGSGNAGNIKITTNTLSLLQGGAIAGSSFNNGIGGSITVAVTDSLGIDGSLTLIFVSGIFANSGYAAAPTVSIGGNINISAKNLRVTDAGVISAVTFNDGRAGNISLAIADTLEIGNSRFQNTTGIFTSSRLNLFTGRSPSGKSGDLIIQAGQVIMGSNTELTVSNAGTGNSGSLTIKADKVAIASNSQISATVLGNGTGGSVDIQAQAIALNGNNSRIVAETSGTGQAGNLTINADSLDIKNGGYISASTLGSGQGGNLNLRVRGNINIEGTGTYVNVLNRLFEQGTGLVSQPTITKPSDIANGILLLSFGSGNAGALNLEANRLNMNNGAFISTATLGNGKGGNLNVGAKDINLNTSQLFADSFGNGNAGNITVSANTLNLLQAGAIAVSSFNNGVGGSIFLNIKENLVIDGNITAGFVSGLFANAGYAASPVTGTGGSINIIARNMELTDSAGITAITFNNGQAGNISLEIADTLKIANSRFENTTGIFASSRLNIFTGSQSSGRAGDIMIKARQLVLDSKVGISVSGESIGDSGNLTIKADKITLNDNAQISANVERGDQGNVTITAGTLQLRNSRITTNAQAAAAGGNIIIDTDTLVGLDRSRITANAIRGQGGNISIFAKGIFFAPNSLITASSEFGVNGSVNLNTNLDPAQGLVNLSTDLPDPSDRIFVGCASRGSSLVVSGRGGLPSNPSATLRGQTIWRDLQATTERETTTRPELSSVELLEANGWAKDANGQIVLLAGRSPTVQVLNCEGEV